MNQYAMSGFHSLVPLLLLIFLVSMALLQRALFDPVGENVQTHKKSKNYDQSSALDGASSQKDRIDFDGRSYLL